MDQTYAEWRHMMDDIGEGPAKPEPLVSQIQFTAPPTPSNISLIPHLESAHHIFSQAFNVDIRLLIWPESWFPGDERLSPLWLRPWIKFPQLQDEMWKKIVDAPEFVNACIFPPQPSIQYTAQLVKWYSVYSEDTLKQFAHRTIDDFLAILVDFLEREPALRYMFSARGQLNFDRPRHCCISVAKCGFEEPAFAVLYIPPVCLTLPELVAGLRAVSPVEVFDKDPKTFEDYASAIVIRAIARIYSRMMGAGIQYGYIYTGEALVFLHIDPKDCTAMEYYLCVPGRDVVSHGYDAHSNWVRRTALGQILAFTLQSLAASPPTQEWQDAVYQSYRPLGDDYSILLPQAPDDIRFNPPAEFMYEDSFWTRFWGNLLQANIKMDDPDSPGSQGSGSDICRPYCTQACLLGTFEKGVLDENCPNVSEHGTTRHHQLSAQEICDRLNEQLRENRYRGFQQLHIIGRTCYLLKATLRSHGYTMMIKATNARQSRRIKAELANYQNLKSLQGSLIPVCLGMFQPKIPYWYHGLQMNYMLLLSWSGIRTDEHTTTPETNQYLEQEVQKLEDVFHEHGVVHKDVAFRNVLWNPESGSFVMIDLEDMKWLKGAPQGSKGHRSHQTQSSIDEIRTSSQVGGKDNNLWFWRSHKVL